MTLRSLLPDAHAHRAASVMLDIEACLDACLMAWCLT